MANPKNNQEMKDLNIQSLKRFKRQLELSIERVELNLEELEGDPQLAMILKNTVLNEFIQLLNYIKLQVGTQVYSQLVDHGKKDLFGAEFNIKEVRQLKDAVTFLKQQLLGDPSKDNKQNNIYETIHQLRNDFSSKSKILLERMDILPEVKQSMDILDQNIVKQLNTVEEFLEVNKKQSSQIQQMLSKLDNFNDNFFQNFSEFLNKNNIKGEQLFLKGEAEQVQDRWKLMQQVNTPFLNIEAPLRKGVFIFETFAIETIIAQIRNQQASETRKINTDCKILTLPLQSIIQTVQPIVISPDLQSITTAKVEDTKEPSKVTTPMKLNSSTIAQKEYALPDVEKAQCLTQIIRISNGSFIVGTTFNTLIQLNSALEHVQDIKFPNTLKALIEIKDRLFLACGNAMLEVYDSHTLTKSNTVKMQQSIDKFLLIKNDTYLICAEILGFIDIVNLEDLSVVFKHQTKQQVSIYDIIKTSTDNLYALATNKALLFIKLTFDEQAKTFELEESETFFKNKNVLCVQEIDDDLFAFGIFIDPIKFYDKKQTKVIKEVPGKDQQYMTIQKFFLDNGSQYLISRERYETSIISCQTYERKIIHTQPLEQHQSPYSMIHYIEEGILNILIVTNTQFMQTAQNGDEDIFYKRKVLKYEVKLEDLQ